MTYRGLKVLVTGADGFIGSHLVEMLASQGADITALALYNSFDSLGWLDDLPPGTRKGIKCVRGDIRDSGQVDKLVRSHEIIFHLAALITIPFSYEAPRAFIDTNVIGTLNILEAARAHGVRRLVHTSTSEVYGTAIYTPINEAHPLQGQSPYSASKIGADMLAESFARSFDVPVTILRPFNTYGPRQSERAIISSTIRQALDPQCSVIRIGDISPRRDFTFVADTAAAFLAAGISDRLENGATYNAGSERAISIGDVVSTIKQLTDCTKPLEQEAGRFRPHNSEVRELLASSERFRVLTGWSAAVSLEDGLMRTVQWWKKRIDDRRARSTADHLI